MEERKSSRARAKGSMDAVLEADRLIEKENEAFDRSRQKFIDELNAEKAKIAGRFEALEARKRALAEQWGNPDASPEDWVEVNCGGRVISARRSTLCQLEGTKFGALFNGLHEKKLEGQEWTDLSRSVPGRVPGDRRLSH